MCEQTINSVLPSEQEKLFIRIRYTTPIIEEHGELHKLTHGTQTGNTDDGGSFPNDVYVGING